MSLSLFLPIYGEKVGGFLKINVVHNRDFGRFSSIFGGKLALFLKPMS
jgi:hypothetical protein